MAKLFYLASGQAYNVKAPGPLVFLVFSILPLVTIAEPIQIGWQFKIWTRLLTEA